MQHNRVPISFRVEWFPTLTSTNDVCMQRTSSNNNEGLVVAAHEQQKGRGQRGNCWTSEQGKNLTFSILLRPTFLRVEAQFIISKVVAISLCELIRAYVHTDDVKIKWPNDIYVGNRKISGVLIENCFSSQFLDVSVVGIGLNVNQLSFPDYLPNPISLAILTKGQFLNEELLSQYLEVFEKWYSILRTNNLEVIDKEYLNLLYRWNQFSCFESGVEKFTAKIVGVSPIGELILRHTDGSEHTYAFKEVKFDI